MIYYSRCDRLLTVKQHMLSDPLVIYEIHDCWIAK